MHAGGRRMTTDVAHAVAMARDATEGRPLDRFLEADFGEIGMSKATTWSLGWAEGTGPVDLFLMPRMPDGFPECEDQAG